MSMRIHPSTPDYELLPRASSDADDLDLDLGLHPRPVVQRHVPQPSWLALLGSKMSGVDKLVDPVVCAHYVTPRRRKRSVLRLIYWSIFSVPYICLFLVLSAVVLFPSYTHRPAHYNELRNRAIATNTLGRANVRNEKVFIAAAIYEDRGALTSGPWGKAVLDLVDLLGPQNVHLSIFENDPDVETRQSLLDFEKRAPCNSTITFEDMDLTSLPRVTLPNGDTRIKRIAFLAEVRNRALAPLDTVPVPFDRILYLNDVNFDPIDATQLLFSTNIDSNGHANYAAACAVDFINAFKFYDRFATRDLEGWVTGIPFFPWFTSAGSAVSRQDVLEGKDAVRVRSCWGGMTAFEAKWFQDHARFVQTPDASPSPVSPLRFRYEEDTFWESSECCLVHADLQQRRTSMGLPLDSGIYMNPYIRVAYDPKTLSWLSLTRRPERLYAAIHDLLNWAIGFPIYNPRQMEEPGQEVADTVWEYDDPVRAYLPNATTADLSGHWREVTRVATPGGFCGGPNLLVINETPQQGEGRWGKIEPPGPAA